MSKLKDRLAKKINRNKELVCAIGYEVSPEQIIICNGGNRTDVVRWTIHGLGRGFEIESYFPVTDCVKKAAVLGYQPAGPSGYSYPEIFIHRCKEIKDR